MKLKSSWDTPVQVALLSGHTIVVGPEGRDVPKMFISEAFKRGCIPINVEVEDLDADNVDLIGEKKIEAIVEGMKEMLNNDCKLTGAGLPNLKDLAKVTGFYVSKLEAFEAWNVLETETGPEEDEAGE